MIPLYLLLLQEFLRDVRNHLAASRPRLALFYLIWLTVFALNFYTVNNCDAPRSRLHVRTFEFLSRWDIGERLSWYVEPPVLLRAETGKWLDLTTRPDAVAAADQIGQLAYYSRRNVIDLLGLTDRHIAHNGFSLDYLLERNPSHIVIFANRNGIPHIPFLAETICDQRFLQRYKLISIIRANHLYDLNEFLVFARRSDNHDISCKTCYLGLNAVEWNRRWRVD
jgi:hypothetical protein